jgi:hypothetical protein
MDWGEAQLTALDEFSPDTPKLAPHSYQRLLHPMANK